MSTAVILDHGLFSWLGPVLHRDFSKVYYTTCWQTTSPTSNQAMIGKGLPGVDLIDDIWQLIEKDASKWHDEGAYDDDGLLLEPAVDLVVVSDLYYNHTVKVLRKLGYRVWGMGDAEYLERDRLMCKRLFHELEIPVEWPVTVCEGMEEVLDFVKKNKGKHFIKSGTGWRGDFETQECCSLDYIQEWVKRIRYRCGELAETMTYIIERAIEGGIEVALDCYTVDGEYPKNCLVGIEKKDEAYCGRIERGDARPKQLTDVYDKLMPWLRSHRARGNMSIETIIDPKKVGWPTDPCFSEDTEVLTDQGWKFFYELDKTERVCTMDPSTRVIEYQQPTDYLCQPYEGEMVLISNAVKGIECLVTPNHGVWRTKPDGIGLYVERADSLSRNGYIPRTGIWQGDDLALYTVPAYHNEWRAGVNHAARLEKHSPSVNVPMASWLRFLACYLSDGSLQGQHGLNITQFDRTQEVNAILSELPFPFSQTKSGFAINSVQLNSHLRGIGLCNEKRVPAYVKALSPRLLRIFLDAYLLFDGYANPKRSDRLYLTTSKGLADDLQELVFKAGGLANISVGKEAGTTMTCNGRSHKRRYNMFRVRELSQHFRFWFEATGSRKDFFLSRVPYDGKVYDVTVPNHIVYVRRNGKPFWSSNCMRLGMPSGASQWAVYQNMGQIAYEGACGHLVETEWDDPCVAEVILHTTSPEWQRVIIPRKLLPFVRLSNACRIDSNYFVMPQPAVGPNPGGMCAIGSVVATGRTMKEAIDACSEAADEIQKSSLDVECSLAGLESITSRFQQLEKVAL